MEAKKKKKAGCLQKNQAFHLVKPLFYIPLQEENTQEVISQSSSLMKSYSLVPRGLTTKKIAEKEKHLWEDIQSKKLQEPSEPSLSLSGVVQLQTQTTLPKWAADADTKSTLTKEQQWLRKTLHTQLSE